MELKEKSFAGIRTLLAKYGVTQGKLAEIIGVSEPSLSYKINGQVEWDSKELGLMADYFDVSVDFLLDRK